MPPTERTARFLEAARARAVSSAPPSRRFAAWEEGFARFADEPWRRRLALTHAHALAEEPLHFLDDERLVGHFFLWSEGFGAPEYVRATDALHEEMRREAPDFFGLYGLPAGVTEGFREESAILGSPMFGPGHIGWHWDWIVAEGVEGVRARVDDAAATADEAGRATLDAMRIALDAFLRWAESHIPPMEARLAAASGAERERLRENIAICRRVPRRGARSFREAVQAFHFAYLAGMFEAPYGGNGPGPLDYYLWPYLERDLASGAATADTARELVDELFIRFHERHRWGNDGFVETIVAGGTAPDGRMAANPLTKILVESYLDLPELTHPALYLRMPENAPDWLWELAVRYLREGGNRAQIQNDAAIVTAMTAADDMPAERARHYMCGGCMELSSFAANGDQAFTGFFNVAKVLEYVLTGGVCLKSGRKVWTHLGRGLPDYPDFEALYGAFREELLRTLELSFDAMDRNARVSAHWRPLPLLSALIEDCIGRGRTINEGGALYEDIGQTPLGLPNVADSLFAIRTAVYDERRVGAEELVAALAADFAGREPLRLELSRLPKYGQGHAGADAMMRRVVDTACDGYARRRNALGGKFNPMIMTFTRAPVEGSRLGATADGRRAGTPIAHGITPQNRAMDRGLGQAMLSATSVPVERFSGGASHIWDLDPVWADPARLRALLEVFFKRGGQMFQGNVLDVSALREARARPEDFPALTVRVGGYSAVFTRLAEENQDEILARHFHGAGA